MLCGGKAIASGHTGLAGQVGTVEGDNLNVREAVSAWRKFASSVEVTWAGNRRTWKDHVSGVGYVDEKVLIQPSVFPRFASEFLGFQVGENLAPERADQEGVPDFTPADSLTHPFVFETKSSRAGVTLQGFETQVQTYLKLGFPRIKRVVLTNLVGLRVFELQDGRLSEVYSVNLLALLSGHEDLVAATRDAQLLLDLIHEFSFKELSTAEKIERVRRSPKWNPAMEPTGASWISARLDRVVTLLGEDVRLRVVAGALVDPANMDELRQARVAEELRSLAWRLGVSWTETQSKSLDDFLRAPLESLLSKALQQYQLHVAYHTTTRLLLVRIWEDLGLLEPTLYDGGFDHWMSAYRDAILRVVRHSFDEAEQRYAGLFSSENNYTWYKPSEQAAGNAVYELGNTYFGNIDSDVLGSVYERLLERVDRKLLGQYYTPRDVIGLIWDLIRPEEMSQTPQVSSRGLRVLDIATGSGGFLVKVAARLRTQLERAIASGAVITRQEWMRDIAAGLNGVEIQPFPAYLAELNLLIQVGMVLAADPEVTVPPLGVVTADTLSLHNPEELFPDEVNIEESELGAAAGDRVARARRLRDPQSSGFWFDVACGNPPYVGEKSAAEIIAKTKRDYPYWRQFVGPHMDYLYWFLILGISKLRQGGRFGFITTEYWLRADGGRPLREYLATRCRIEHVLLFRNLKLFPDAPGQHSLVIVGERTAASDAELSTQSAPESHKPYVSFYEGQMVGESERALVLDAMREHRSAAGVRSIRAAESPNDLAGESWATVTLSKTQLARRRRLTRNSRPLQLDSDEGVLSGADALSDVNADALPRETLAEIRWSPGARPGIFVLSGEELAALGTITAEERSLIMPVVNTRDVLPYAACLPSNPKYLINLGAPPRDPLLSVEELQVLPFPPDMPALERHLTRYRPVLERKVRSYGERRPWWSIHRARPDIQSRAAGHGSWADYSLTTRWGGGGRLIVGLAPSGSVPASGLHALFAPSDVPAAYLTGLMNSTVIQELAETLPPGEIRVTDLMGLHLPLLDEARDEISSRSLSLADLVCQAKVVHAPKFPLLLQGLLEDVSLSDVTLDAWRCAPGARLEWGELRNLTWCEELTVRGAQSVPATGAEPFEELWGHGVRLTSSRNSEMLVRIGHVSQEELAAFLAYMRGLVNSNARLQDIPRSLAPTSLTHLVAQYRQDSLALAEWVRRYQEHRAAIDEIVEVAV